MTQFTIVITTHNRLNYLKRAIDSAMNQTVKCEIVVVDDCSDDGTIQYLQTLSNQVTWYQNPENLGHSYSVNKGVQISQGKWIKLLDDDDYLALTCIEEISKIIEEYPSAVICSCLAINVNEKQQKLGITRKVSKQEIYFIKQEDIHYLMLLDKLPFGTPVQVAFRKDAFLKSGGWNSSFDYCHDDIESWIKIAQFGNTFIINKPLVYRTMWTGGKNQKISINQRLENNILVKNKIYKLVSNKYKNNIPALSEIHKYLTLYWSFIALKHKRIDTFILLFSISSLSITAWKLLLSNLSLRWGSQSIETG